MAGSINKVILVGNLGKDPEVRFAQEQCKGGHHFLLATSESWKDKNSGEKKDRTEWHRIVIFSPGLADVAEKYLQKRGQDLYRRATAYPQMERYIGSGKIYNRNCP